MGMAHRGRLNVLVNTLGKIPADLFSEFEGKAAQELPAGDVKYHQGFSSDIATPGGPTHVTLAFVQSYPHWFTLLQPSPAGENAAAGLQGPANAPSPAQLEYRRRNADFGQTARNHDGRVVLEGLICGRAVGRRGDQQQILDRSVDVVRGEPPWGKLQPDADLVGLMRGRGRWLRPEDQTGFRRGVDGGRRVVIG